MERRHAGYTLVELMVVLSIIAIIAAVAIPMFDQYAQKARVEELKSALLMVAAAQDRHFAARGRYTNVLTDLAGYGYKPVAGTEITIGVQITAISGMGYWVAGNADIDRTAEAWNECWVLLGRNLPQPQEATGGFMRLYNDGANATGYTLPFVDKDTACKP